MDDTATPTADVDPAVPSAPLAVVSVLPPARARAHGVDVSRPRVGAPEVIAPEVIAPGPVPSGVDASRWAAVWQHRPYLLAVARRRVPWHDAEDVVHEAVLRAIRDVLIPEARLRSWLVTTTVRLCADRHRDEASQRRRRLLHAARPETTVQPGPEDAICDADEARWIASQVAMLPGRQAEAVRLRAEGLSTAEVGVEMGVPPKAVESLLGRARRVLKAAAAAGITIWAGTRIVLKRKTQIHVIALGLGAACSASVYGWEVSQDVASYSAHQMSSALAPSLRSAEHWTWHRHPTRHRHRTPSGSGATSITTAAYRTEGVRPA